MGFRITTSMMMNTYRHNLMQSTNYLNDSRTKVETKRKFNSYAENPAAATHAWRLRRAYSRNENYTSSNTEATQRFEIAKSAMETIDDKMLNGTTGAKQSIKYADNDPTAGARTALGRVLSELSESVIFTMNGAKYGDHFVFAGNDEMNAPFSWSEDGKTLYYRGINVGAGAVPDPTQPPDWGQMVPRDMPTDSLNEDEKAWIKYYSDPNWNDANGAAATPVTDTIPSWVPTPPTDTSNMVPIKVRDMGPLVPKDMPQAGAKGNTAADEEWIAWYSNGSPAGSQPTSAEPAWASSDMAPLNKRDASAYELAWYDYYANGGPDPSASVPAWDTTTDPYGAPLDGSGAGVKWDPDNMTNIEKAYYAYYNDQADLKKLEAMAVEHEIMDLGMGLQEEGDRELINATAFDRSLPGITMLGYGVDEDGDPKNIALIMKRLAELYADCDPDSGDFGYHDENGEFVKSDEIRDEVYRLLDKFGVAHDNFNYHYSDISAKAQFLQANEERLEEQSFSLAEQVIDIEQVDLADAISRFMWDYNCYSAALKIGTQLLSQSLIDYMA